LCGFVTGGHSRSHQPAARNELSYLRNRSTYRIKTAIVKLMTVFSQNPRRTSQWHGGDKAI
jgi:hypothetical protein